MIRMSLRAPLVCLFSVVVSACAAGSDLPDMKAGTGASDDDSGLDLNVGPDGRPIVVTKPGSKDEPAKPAVDDPADVPDDDDHDTSDCAGSILPGIQVAADGKISVEVPNVGTVIVAPIKGSCGMSGSGINVLGDITLDLGSGKDIPLLNADIDIIPGLDGDMPVIAGIADISGAVLDTILPGTDVDLTIPVTIELDTDTHVPGSHTGVAIDLALEMPHVTLPAGDLAELSDGLVLVNADVVLATDGAHDLVKVWGTVDANADLALASLPLDAVAALDATATIAGDALVRVALEGDVNIVGGQHHSGPGLLATVKVPEAMVLIDEQGIQVVGKTHAAVHTLISATANATVNASITKHEWNVKVCADAMLDLHLLNAAAAACVKLTVNGALPIACTCVDEPVDVPSEEY